MAGDEVSVIVGEEDKLEIGVSLGDEVGVGFVVEEGVDDEALLVGLDVVGEDSQFGCLELGHVVVVTRKLADESVRSVHELFLLLYFPDKKTIGL